MILIISLGTALAQVNAEVLAAQAKEEGFGVGLSAGSTFARGNVDLFSVRGDAGVQWLSAFDEAPNEQLWLQDRLILSVRGAYQTFNGVPILDERLAHLRGTHMFTPRLGAEAFLQAQNDLALLLEWRLLAGAGARFVVMNEPRLAIWGGLGPMAEYEIRNVPADGPDAPEVLNLRLTSFLAWRAVLAPEHLTWNNTVYFQPRLDEFADIQFVNESSFDLAITKTLSFTTGLRLRLDTRAPADLEPLDLRWSTGLTVRWMVKPEGGESS